MNSVNLVGRLTKDVEITIAENGTNVGRFTIAVNRKFSKDNQPKADFISCTAFNNTALNLHKYCKKGSLISVEGQLQTSTYEKDGKTNYSMNVIANNIQYLAHVERDKE